MVCLEGSVCRVSGAGGGCPGSSSLRAGSVRGRWKVGLRGGGSPSLTWAPQGRGCLRGAQGERVSFPHRGTDHEEQRRRRLCLGCAVPWHRTWPEPRQPHCRPRRAPLPGVSSWKDPWPHVSAFTPPVQSVSSVAQSCPTLCAPMNRSTPGLPVDHKLPEFTQTHAHRVNDAIQPSHPRSSSSPLPPIPPSIRVFSNESTLLIVGQNIGVQLQHQSFQ